MSQHFNKLIFFLYIAKKKFDLFIIVSSFIEGQSMRRRLRNPGSSCSEGSVDAGMNGVVLEASVEKPAMKMEMNSFTMHQ